MSEETKTPGEPVRTVEAPMTSFVKGGTLTTNYENQLKQKRHDAEERRKAEADRHRIAAEKPMEARMGGADLGSRKNHAAIVLEFRNSDGKAEEFIMCELNAGRGDDPTELVLVMCCPYCAKRVGSDEAQFHFSSKHKKFELDTRRQGELWVNPTNPREFVTLAGTIQLTEAVRCPGVGCQWRFKIDSSVIRTL